MNAMMLSPTNSNDLNSLLEKALTTKINDRDMFMKGIDYSYYYEENNEWKIIVSTYLHPTWGEKKENIESRPVWKPMHIQPLYKKCEYIRSDDRDVSAELFEKGLCLPSGSNLSENDQNRIIDIILDTIKSA